jgi:hypothetical protein
MTRQEELEIEIDAAGKVRVHVKGIAGTGCMEYLKVFQRLLGPTSDEMPTEEYYEAEIAQTAHQRQSRY